MAEVILIKTVTPEDAERYIESNYENNRPLRQSLINKYADDMEKGLFRLNISAPIIFSESGKLIDGQHRLYACIQAGVPFKSYIVQGAEESLYQYIDIGSPRTVADQINSSWKTKIATLARLAGATRHGKAGIGSSLQGMLKPATTGKAAVEISKTQTIIEAETYKEEFIPCLQQGQRMKKIIGKWGEATFAYFVWLVRWTDRDILLNEFIDSFCDLGCTNKTINLVRTKMLQRATIKNITTRRSWVISALLFAYDAFVSGRTVKQFKNSEDVLNQWNEYVKERRESNEQSL